MAGYSAEEQVRALDRAMVLLRTIGDESDDYEVTAKALYANMTYAEVGMLVDALVMLAGSIALAGSRVGRSAIDLIEEAYHDNVELALSHEPDDEPPQAA